MNNGDEQVYNNFIRRINYAIQKGLLHYKTVIKEMHYHNRNRNPTAWEFFSYVNRVVEIYDVPHYFERLIYLDDSEIYGFIDQEINHRVKILINSNIKRKRIGTPFKFVQDSFDESIEDDYHEREFRFNIDSQLVSLVLGYYDNPEKAHLFVCEFITYIDYKETLQNYYDDVREFNR